MHQVYISQKHVWPKLRDQVDICWLEKELSWPIGLEYFFRHKFFFVCQDS